MDSDKNFVWVTRSFLDYRVPVFAELDKLCGGKLTVIYNGDYVPQRVQDKLRYVLGARAVALHGEKRVGPNVFSNKMANMAVRIPWQKGLLHEVKMHQPSVLISDGFFQWTAPCLWMNAHYGIPHLMCYERTVHTERNAQWYRKLYRKIALRYIDAVCCSGRLCGEYAQSLGVSNNQISYGHMVADVTGLRDAYSNIDSSARKEIRDLHKIKGMAFLYIGQLIARKGVMELLRAWSQFIGTHATDMATLILIGNGSEKESARKFCDEHGLKSVRFMGNIDYEKIATFYAAADCFVMPTLEDNWSLVVPEAMACKLPVLCSKYNGCWPELVKDGVNGWVFDPLDKECLVSHLSKAFANVEALKAMGRRSQEIVAEYTPYMAAKSIFDSCAGIEI